MALIIVISLVALVCSVVALVGCFNCFMRKKPQFTNFSNIRTPSEVSVAQNNDAFTAVDIEDVQNETVNIEPLPDIAKNIAKNPCRPKIKCTERGSHEAFISVSSGQRSFPRDHLTYLNEIGSGWFGQAIESEALKIVGGSLKSHVVVKMLKDDASKAEKKQFMDEVIAFRCLEHTNVMSFLGQCSETTPYLVIMEYAANGNLKTYLISHKVYMDTLIKKNALIKFCLDAAAGLACLHRHDFIHCDIAARNCLVMGDLTVKIGDYGVAETVFKEDYYDSGQELLPIRWMAPETLIQAEGLWTSNDYAKSSDIWSFGILLWEIFSMGEQPYEMYSDEAVLQGVVLDRLVTPAELSPKIPNKDKLSLLMKSLWQEPLQRPNIEDTHQYLEQMSVEKSTVVATVLDDGSDFDQKWNHLVPKDDRSYSIISEADMKIGLEENHKSESLSEDQPQPSSSGATFGDLKDQKDLEMTFIPQDKIVIEDEIAEKGGKSSDFIDSPHKALSVQEITTSTPIINRNNTDLVAGSSLTDNKIEDTMKNDNQSSNLDSNGFEFTEFVSSEPADTNALPKTENQISELSKEESKDIESLGSSGFEFTDFVSSTQPDDSLSVTQKQTDTKDDLDRSMPFNDDALRNIPKDSDTAIQSPISTQDKAVSSNENFSLVTLPSLGDDLLSPVTQSEESKSETVPSDITAEQNFSNNRQNEAINNQSSANGNNAPLLGISSSSPETTVEHNKDKSSNGDTSLLTLDFLSDLELPASQATTVNDKESDLLGAFSSLPSIQSDFNSDSSMILPHDNKMQEAFTVDLLTPQSDISLYGSSQSKANTESPSKVLKEAEVDLMEALDNNNEAFSTAEFLGDKSISFTDSSKDQEGDQGTSPLTKKVGTPSICDESSEPNSHPSAMDSCGPADYSSNHLFLESGDPYDSPPSRRKLEFSAEELSKIFLESSSFKLSPTKEQGPSLYRSSNIDLRTPLGSSSSLENEDDDLLDDNTTVQDLPKPPVAPSASPVDSEAEETSETSSNSGSGREYSCVSPLDTGQPPTASSLDVDSDKENLKPDSSTMTSSDSELTEDDMAIIKEMYLSKGLKSPRVYETPTLETIPEHQPMHFISDQKTPSLSISGSDSSSVEVKYEDLFGNDSYEWDDFCGDPIVSDINESESHVQYLQLSNHNIADWSLSLDSDSHPSLSSVQSAVISKSAASTSVCSASDKRDSDEQSVQCLSDSELSVPKSSRHSPQFNLISSALAKPYHSSALTNISVLSSDQNSSYYSLSEDYEAHLSPPLDVCGSPPAIGMEDDKKFSSSTSSPSPSFPSSPSVAPHTGHVNPEGHLDGLGLEPVSASIIQNSDETSNSSFDLEGINLTSSPISPVNGSGSVSGSQKGNADVTSAHPTPDESSPAPI